MATPLLQVSQIPQHQTYWVDQHGRYWISNQAASGGTVNTANSTYVGTTSAGNQAAAYNPRAGYPAVEDAGIRAGEIIGYRAWQLYPDLSLHSMYVNYYVWSPNQSAKTSDRIDDHSGHGFHAFKSLAKAKLEYNNRSSDDCPVVYGEVTLWGKVIEHERGYRAECARIVRLYSITTKPRWKDRLPNSTLKQLRRKYGVNTGENHAI